jgi:hypothetical protein
LQIERILGLEEVADKEPGNDSCGFLQDAGGESQEQEQAGLVRPVAAAASGTSGQPDGTSALPKGMRMYWGKLVCDIPRVVAEI